MTRINAAGPGGAEGDGRNAPSFRTPRWLSLRFRFVLALGVMLLPLVNLAGSAWYCIHRIDLAVAGLVQAAGGSSSVQAELAQIDAVRRGAHQIIIVVCLGGALSAAIVGRLLARSILRPLGVIEQGVKQLGAGNSAHRLRLRRRDELGVVAAAFDTMADALQRGQQDLTHRATHDSLTGLPNRLLLRSRLCDPQRVGSASLLLGDIDDFKTVNDSLGHLAGDEVLVTMAARLQAAVGPDGLCARLGGDEFAVMLEQACDEDAAMQTALAIRAELTQPLAVAGRTVRLDATVGVVSCRAGADPQELLRDADLAMYAGKRAGGGRAEPFVPALHTRAVARLELEAELRAALGGPDLLPYYQPVVDLGTGRMVGVEALARWQHPERGLVPPDAFIPLAEESDLILGVGRQILERACVDMAGWLQAHPQPEPFSVNVNLSARQLQDPALPDLVREVLLRSGLPAHVLTLEITETVVMTDPESSLARLEALTDLGVQLAVDDFGTGYSSLGYLQRFPITTLKVDRSFVAPIDSDPGAARLTGAVLQLAETLGLKVTAEGVETREQAELLHALGCRRAQGYLYSRPVPLAELSSAGTGALRSALPAQVDRSALVG